MSRVVVMEVHQVSAVHGWRWIVEGFAMFKKNPVIWLALFFVYLLIGLLLSQVKLVGPIVLNLLAPVFVAGFMFGCRALENDDDLEINHLFAGFKHHAAQLISVGGMYLAGIIIIAGIMFAGSDNTVLQAILSGDKLAQQQAAAALGPSFLLIVLFGLLLMSLLIMAYWFAPVLVTFHEMSAVDAMKLSFRACLYNILPFFVYGLISMVLLLLAAIPYGLGLLIMIPTMTASLYISYKDIFNVNTLPQTHTAEEDDE